MQASSPGAKHQLSSNGCMQGASPIFGSSATICDDSQYRFAFDQKETMQVWTGSRGGTPQELHSPQRLPHPPVASRFTISPHPVSLKTSARSVTMVQRVLRGLSGSDSSNEACSSKFVEDGMALQQDILEEVRGRLEAQETLRRTQAASALDWSRRNDDILENMSLLQAVANELSRNADAHVADLKERQAENEKELVKVAAKAQQDVKLLMERTSAQIELMRAATQTVVRYVSGRCMLKCIDRLLSEMNSLVASSNGKEHSVKISSNFRQNMTTQKSYGTAN